MALDDLSLAMNSKSSAMDTRATAELDLHPVSDDDAEMHRIVAEEQSCLRRVIEHVSSSRTATAARPSSAYSDYDAQLIALRDEMASARLEDLPPLLEQMERLQSLADQRRKDQGQGSVDLRCPYFGRIVLEESGTRREVLVGRSTYLDTHAGVRIVDWRDAPVSRMYYRYQEGDSYCEVFGGREREGKVVVRRSLSIADSELCRISCPQGTFARDQGGDWHRLDQISTQLSGGEGLAPRPSDHRPGVLGVGRAGFDENKSLREITALIDPGQFDLVSRPDSGLVVIQGGAGSGKTTIGLHRLAYLTFRDPRRFRTDRMLVVVFNEALSRYIAQVLPSLGVEGVAIRTYAEWAARLRRAQFPRLDVPQSQETPSAVSRLKKSPAMLRIVDDFVADTEEQVRRALGEPSGGADEASGSDPLLEAWHRSEGRPLQHRAYQLLTLARSADSGLSVHQKVRAERVATTALRHAADVPSAFCDLLGDAERLTQGLGRYAPGSFTGTELAVALGHCAANARALATYWDHQADGAPGGQLSSRSKDFDSSADDDDSSVGIDGQAIEEHPMLDGEDDALLLLLHQKLRGPFLHGTSKKEALIYEHIFVDEAQDYSPVELAVLVGTVSPGRSMTLAGDVAQRLQLDNGFSDWNTVLSDLGLSHVQIDPLRISYRSTQEIIDLAVEVLGPLAPENPGSATRSGAPVELFRFADRGEGAGFLAEQLRTLVQREPRASVAVVARYPEQADAYFSALERAEVPHLRRISEQDFPFRPGVDVTDIGQVKGLEFDYVILVDVDVESYPERRLARHLLHVGATRAAHQLWMLTSRAPSLLLPSVLRERVR